MALVQKNYLGLDLKMEGCRAKFATFLLTCSHVLKIWQINGTRILPRGGDRKIRAFFFCVGHFFLDSPVLWQKWCLVAKPNEGK